MVTCEYIEIILRSSTVIESRRPLRDLAVCFLSKQRLTCSQGNTPSPAIIPEGRKIVIGILHSEITGRTAVRNRLKPSSHDSHTAPFGGCSPWCKIFISSSAEMNV